MYQAPSVLSLTITKKEIHLQSVDPIGKKLNDGKKGSARGFKRKIF